MVSRKNVTLGRKRRPLWYGMLCLALITAAVASVGLFSSQIDDAMSIESEHKYTLTDGDKNILESSDVLEEIMKFINDSDEYFVFTIIVNGDDTIFNELTLDEGREVTLTSSSDKVFKLTFVSPWERHFKVSGILTLENIILDSDRTKYSNVGSGGIDVEASGTLIMKDGVVIQKCFAIYGGGVYIKKGGTFTMYGGEISGNFAASGGGVRNNGEFTMYGGEISNNIARESAGGVYNVGQYTYEDDVFIYVNGKFIMEGGKISDNKAVIGGGVSNSSEFVVDGGVISGNEAELFGGGVYNSGEFTVEGSVISDNTANGTNYLGSGGGIFTTDYEILTVKDGVVFSGNTAPTLRTQNIDDEEMLAKFANISNKVVLSAPVKPGLNAPAVNDYDINCIHGDAYVVTIVIDPYGGGAVAVKDKGKDTVYANGYVYVPLSGDEITLSATPKTGYEFALFSIGETESFDISITFEVSGNMEVTAEFLLVSTQPEKPEQKDYVITATANDGSTISPSGTVTVPYGENKTFLFSAKPGYQIKAVLVNGVEISSAELASGAYTFSNVMSNHTISVVSEVEAGSGGDIGGDGSDGTGSGPDVSGSDNLYVLGIICALLVVIAGAVVFVWRKGYFGSNNE